MKKVRWLPILLVLIMILELLPLGVLAAGGQNGSIQARWSDAITVDGSLTESVWLSSQAIGTEQNMPSGQIAAAWDKTNLYLGVWYENADTLTVEKGNFSKMISLTAASSNVNTETHTAELSLSWAELGVTLFDYHQTIDGFKITLSSGASSSVLNASVETAMAVTDQSLVGKLTPKKETVSKSSDGTSISWNAAAGSSYGWHVAEAANQASIDHTKDLLIEQDLRIDALPWGASAKLTALNTCANSVYFSFTDVDDRSGNDAGSGLSIAVYNHYPETDGSLWLRLHNDEYGSNGSLDVSLGKKIGDTFRLSFLWKADNSAVVYVDGVQIAAVENATIGKTGQRGTKCARITYYGKDAANFTVSNMRVSSPSTESVIPAIENAVLNGAVLENIEASLTLPTVYADSILGDIPLTWTSSNPSVLGNDGTVTRPAGGTAVTVTLTLSVGTTKVKDFTVTVSPTALQEQAAMQAVWAESITLDGALTEKEWVSTQSIGSNSGPRGEAAAAWNKDYLFLAVSYADATNFSVSTGGKKWDIDLTSASQTGNTANNAENHTAELQIPWSDLGGAPKDYYQTLRGLTITLSGEAGSASLLTGVTNTTLTGKSISLDSFGAKSGVTVSGNTATWDATGSAAIEKSNIAYVDHSKDVLLTQEFDIASLENGYGTLSATGFTLDKGLYFWISDRTLEGGKEVSSAALFCSIFWSQNENMLYFRVTGNSDGSKRLNYSAPLDKTFNEKFRLSVLWGADESIQLFLDGKPILNKENATITDLKGLGTKHIAFSSQGSAKLTLSNFSICTSERKAIKDVLLAANLLSESALKSLASDLNLPTVYHDKMLGDITLTWTSSNPSVLSSDGKVTPPASGTASAVLTLSVNGAEIKKWDVTVCRAAIKAGCADTVSVDGILQEKFWYLAYPLLGDLNGSVYTVYNRNGLYLGLTYSDADTAVICLNGKEITVKLADGTVTGLTGAAAASRNGTAEIFLPWTELGITLEDYNQLFSDFSVSLNNAAGNTASLAGSLRITSEQVKSISVVPEVSKGVTYENGVGTWDTNATSAVSLCGKNPVIDHSKDILFNQELRFEAMPKGDGLVTNKLATRNCYHFWVCDKDDKAKDESGAWINNAGTSLFCTVYDPKADDGFLRLRVIKNLNNNEFAADVSLGKKLGEKFTLSVLWRADDSVVVYVDNQIVGEAENGTSVATRGMGDKYVYLRYTAVAGTENAKFTVANVNVVITAAESVLDEITEDLLLPNVDLTHINRDIMLPSMYESAYIGSVPITWESSNPAVLSANGEVGEVTQSTDVTLTASVRGKVILTKVVTVIPSSGSEQVTAHPSPVNITTAFSAAPITVNGKVEEEGWILNTNVLDADGKLKGKFGAQWQKDALYLAANVRDVSTLKLTLAEKTAEISLADLTHSGTLEIGSIQKSLNYIELSIPFSAIGVAPAYDLVLPIRVEMGSCAYNGNLILSSVDWFCGENEYRPLKVYPTRYRLGDGYPVDGYQDYEQIADGWRMYDLYNPTGENPARARTEIAYWKDSAYSGLGDRSSNIYAEFDFYAKEMPVYDVNADIGWHDGFASYGMTWWIAENEDGGSSVNSVSFGIMNTENGLIFAALRNGTTPYMKLLNKQVGDSFRVGTMWKVSGDVDIYIDGVKISTIEGVECRRKGYGDKVIAFNLIRNATYATSVADNLDVTVTNLGLGHNFSPVDEVTFDTIRGENTKQDSITSSLYLPVKWVDTRLNEATTITWTSSEPAVVNAETGVVTRPATGAKQVRLTAAFSDGTSKTFDLLVLGNSTESGNVLVAVKDYDPAHTAGAVTDKVMFTLDTDNNSVICDLSETKTFNVVALKDGDSFSRLNEEVLQLWVSDDNQTYTRVKDFKLLHKENVWYLYDFSATARYVKVHCTHFNGDEADFTGVTSEMITAYQQNVFGYESNDFQSKTYSLSNNGSETRYDYAWHISKTDLDLSGSDASIRVFLGNEMLYHYTTDTELIVRVPQLNAGASASLRILYGSEGAMDVANQEYVYEVTYGTREARNVLPNVRWIYRFEKSGKIIGMSDNGTSQGLNCAFSTDDGRTWTDRKKIDCTVGKFTGTCGFIYDSHTGRLMVSGYLETDSEHATIGLIYTDDEGETWHYIGTVETDGQYLCSYTDGIELSCYDGDGPNVDFVFTACYKTWPENVCKCQPIYSCDAGKTWQSAEPIYYQENVSWEGGMSEATLMERDDGVIVLICRNQGFGLDNFAQSYSYDHGKTWMNPAKLSSIYTVNTQPILFRYGNEVLLSWGGNNMMGGESRLRTPHSIGVTYDAMETFRNIQDLYVKYSFQGLTNASMNRITNQKVVITEQDTFLSCWMNLAKAQSEWTNMLIRVEDFHDYFYRTKNAYDSFEHGTVKYEGWDCTRGTAAISNEQATNGKYSMKLEDAVVARSIPSIQNGTVSMDIFVDGTANFTLELQSAYTNIYGKGAPIGLSVSNNVVTFTGADSSIGTLRNGWNTLTFNLCMDADAPAATFVLNGADAVAIPVNTAIGDYACFITVMNSGSLMIDNVLVESSLDALNAKAEYEANVGIADQVEAKIDAIGTVTLESESAIKEARRAYDALDRKQKVLVLNYAELEAAEAELEKLKASADQNAANEVIAKIDAIGDVTIDSGDAIQAAREAYEALTEAQKKLVTNYQALVEAEKAYAALVDQPTPAPVIPSKPSTGSNASDKDLPFLDVSKNDWFYQDVKKAYEAGIMNGASGNRFEPNAATTRGMIVTILYRLENEPAVNDTCAFTDVSGGAYYEKAVIWASANGIVTGYSNTAFGPADSITREQLAAILYRYAKYKGYDMSAHAELNRYADVTSVSTYAKAPMEWAVANGLISGTSATQLSTKNTATRAQVAAIFMRLLDLKAN